MKLISTRNEARGAKRPKEDAHRLRKAVKWYVNKVRPV